MTDFIYPPGHVYARCPNPACDAPLMPGVPILVIGKNTVCDKPGCRQWGRQKREEEKQANGLRAEMLPRE